MGLTQSKSAATDSKSSKFPACPLHFQSTPVAAQHRRRAGTPRSVPTGTLLLRHIQLLATFSRELGDIAGMTASLPSKPVTTLGTGCCFADAAIYVKANVIHWVGKTDELPQGLQKADVVQDMSNRVVIPGLVCCHHHMYQVKTGQTFLYTLYSCPSVSTHGAIRAQAGSVDAA